MLSITFLQDLQRISRIPLSWYQGTELKLRKPELSFMDTMIDALSMNLYIQGGSAVLHATDELMILGLLRIKGTNEHIIFGPVSGVTCSNMKAQSFLHRCGLPSTAAGQVVQYFQSIPNCSLSRFATFLRLVSFIVNQEEIDINQLLPEESEYSEEETSGTVNYPAPIHYHDARQHEEQMYALIEHGRIHDMKSFIQTKPYTEETGMTAENASRHRKNMVIASVTMASRAAVKGGLEYETAMKTADIYIQKVELTTTYNALYNLHRNMLRQFTQMVYDVQQNRAESALVARVHQYIDANVDAELSVQSIADALGINRSYLSTQFKKESGINLNQFINQIKLEEAKRLLQVTDKSISDIAVLLHFSSQSHFQAVFKKIIGMTPKEYREK